MSLATVRALIIGNGAFVLAAGSLEPAAVAVYALILISALLVHVVRDAR